VNTSELLLLAARAGMKFWLDGGKLAFRIPAEGMTDELRNEIILHKAELIAMLQKERLDSASAISRAAVPESSDWQPASNQERLWLIERRIGASPLHNLHFRLLWKGSLDRGMLADSLTDIVARHAALRTTFSEFDGGPRAIVSPAAAADLDHLDLRDLPPEARAGAAEAFILDHQCTPFDLEKGPMMRTAVITLANDDHIIVVTQHHLVTDGWSVGIFLTELGRCYRARYLDQYAGLPELPVQYSDYARWQRERETEPSYQEDLAWWKEHLAGLPPLELPGARRAHAGAPDYHGISQDLFISSALALRLKDMAREQHCTLFTVLLTAWATLLHRYTSQSDFAVGTATSGRDRPELQNLIGFFTNTMMLRCDLSGNPSFVDALRRLRAETESAFKREVQFADVVLAAGAVPGASLTPLIQAAFIFENIPMPQILDPEIGIHAMLDPQIDGSAQGTSKFDLALFMQESTDGIRGCLKYADAQFEPSAFQRLGEHFQILLESVAHNPDETLGRLLIVSARERRQILTDWNDTEPGGEWPAATFPGRQPDFPIIR
jgi:condensation domain-containing protein/tubulysin polyketide synthase-like protein